MNRNEFKRITPTKVVRGEDGFWEHPEFPVLDEGYQAFKSWLDEHQLVSTSVEFEYDAPEQLCDEWYTNGTANCSAWEPSRPEGEHWFMLGIFDGEDGPVCHWVRYIEDAERHGKGEGCW